MLVGSVTVDDANLVRILTRLDAIISPGSLARFLSQKADPYMRKRAADRFASEGDDASGKWHALAPATVGFRESEGFPGRNPINVRTGQLEDYIVGTRGFVSQASGGAQLTLPGPPASGTLREKFKTAQQGKASPHTSPRPVLAMNQRDQRAVLTDLMFFIGGAV